MDKDNWLEESLADARREFSQLSPDKQAWIRANRSGPVTSSGKPFRSESYKPRGATS